MKNIIIIICLVLLAILFFAAKTKKTKMKGVAFAPDMYNRLEENAFASSAYNICTDKLPYRHDWNFIDISAPQKIIFNASAPGFEPVIPVCGHYMIGDKWGLKYYELPGLTLHIRREGEEEWHSAEVDHLLRQYTKYKILETPAPSPWESDEKAQAELHREREAAKKFTDEEVREKVGQASGSMFTENLLDYIDIRPTSGIYEIYASILGLKSNKVKVKIVFKS